MAQGSYATTYSVPVLARVQGTIPLSGITPESHVLCHTRADVQGTDVSSRSMCYYSFKPDPPLALPIIDFLAAHHQAVPGAFVPATGALFLTYAPCTEFFPGYLAAAAALAVQLDKGGGAGSGSVVVSTDETAPFDCADAVVATGSATLTPLGQSNDEDADGCPDWNELGSSANDGGLRDPFNPYDYFNPTDDGFIRVDDILAVVQQFFKDDTDANPGQPPYAAGYDPETDRTSGPGPGVWNLGPGNGQQRVDDILHVIRQFFHDCP
jgi:hypothetical protein